MSDDVPPIPPLHGEGTPLERFFRQSASATRLEATAKTTTDDRRAFRIRCNATVTRLQANRALAEMLRDDGER